MAKKLFNLPASLEDIPRAIGTKDFFVNTDFLSTVALNLLRKWGFVPSFGLDYFDDIPIGISTLGLPVFDNIEFLGGQYSVINANTLQQIIPYNGLKIDTVIVEASQRKNIIKTEIAGRDGAVKEYISGNDTTISITGAIVNTFSNAYPRRDVQDLVRILNVPEQLHVRSKFINDILGFESIVIESWRLSTTPGSRNTQAFQIEAVNDISKETDEVTGELL